VVQKTSKSQRAIGTQKWKKLRLIVLARDGYVCYVCGSGDANQVDHIYPRSKGGAAFDPLNCAAICRPCNMRKGDKVFLAKEATPPVFPMSSPSETVRIIPDSPFTRPD
jgi:5-methylcytosine-specific restriction endonuclease McrA